MGGGPLLPVKLTPTEIENRVDAAMHAAGRRSFEPTRVIARRYHFHSPLLVYVVTTVVLVFGAINGQNNLLFWLFGLAVGGLIVSGFLSGSALMGIQLEREVPERGEVGEPMHVRYRIRNTNRFFPACAMIVEEIERGPGGRGSTWRRTGASCEAFIARVEGREAGVCVAEFVPKRRGEYSFACVRVSTTFPFGLTRKSVVFHAEQTTLVRPKRVETPRPGGRRGAEQAELRTSSTRAREGEFFSLRDYADGDPARAIAWRATARLGRPVVKESVLPPAKREIIMLDAATAGEMREAVVSVAAGIADRSSRDGVVFALAARDGGTVVPFGRGPRHLANALDALAHFDGGGSSPLPSLAGVAVTVVHAGGPPSVGGDAIVDASFAAAHAEHEPEDSGATASILRRVRVIWESVFAGGGEAKT